MVDKKNYTSFKHGGFTLLEIVIVIIITGVLAGLAISRFFKTIEFSRANEALSQLSAIRRAMDRCYLINSNYSSCNNFSTLDVEDPASLSNVHFTYSLGTPGATTFTITATRNTFNGGDGSSIITINENGVKSGSGSFSNIQ